MDHVHYHLFYGVDNTVKFDIFGGCRLDAIYRIYKNVRPITCSIINSVFPPGV